MKTYFLFLLLLIGKLTAAQQTEKLQAHGVVMNKERQPLVYASVSIYKKGGGLLKGTVTDSTGRFVFDQLMPGAYYTGISLVGFVKYQSDVFTLNATDPVTELPAAILEMAGGQLKEVTVSAAKKLIEMQADKMVMNIENSILATGNSVFEVLKKAPGVTADKDDNLRLNGAATKIFIDGKPFYLSGSQLTEYLKNLPSDVLSKIEIISNPSSKYDAEGSGGILNIRLKKNQAYGLNGTAGTGTGYGKYPKANANLNLNYRHSKWNIFGGGNAGYAESYNRLNYNSVIRSGGGITGFQDRENYWHPVTKYQTFRAGADYNLGKRTTLGGLFTGSLNRSDAQTDNLTVFSDGSKNPYAYINSVRDGYEHTTNYSYNLNFKTELDTLGSELNIDADHAVYSRTGIENNANSFTNTAGDIIRTPYVFRNNQPASVNIKAIKADFTRVFPNKLKMQMGAKFSWVSTDNNLVADSLHNGNWQADISRTNHFVYDENINAGYFILSRDFGKTSVQAGLRAEQTISTGNSITMNRIDKRNYTGLFPSLFISRKLNEDNQLNFSYTRRINRPGYQSLNPFTWYVDPFTIFAGNPFLQPSYSNNFELKHGFKQIIFTSLSYRHATGVATTVIRQDKITGTVTNTTENANAADNVSLNISAGIPINKWWSADNNISLAYGKSHSSIQDFSYNQEAFTANLYTAHTFTLPKDIRIQTDIYYAIPYREGLSQVKSFYSWGLAIQKQVLQKKGTIRLSWANIIGTSAYRSHIVSDQLDIMWKNRWEGKRVNLSFSWKFGKLSVKSSRNRTTGLQDEKNRVNL